MLTENFSSIELGDAAAYAPYFRALPLHAADYTFTNLWGWGTHYNLEWRTAHGLCWIRQKRNDLPVERLWAPVGDWYAADWAAMPELVPGTTILRAPRAAVRAAARTPAGRVAIEETPGQWEYLYTQEALSTLAGNKLHKKKNHVNGYMKAYGEDYRALNGEIMPQVLALQDDWCKWRECEKSASLLAESDVVCSVLRNWDALPGLIGGALYAGEEMAAFAVGEPLDDQTIVVHFEKGRPEYRGRLSGHQFLFRQVRGQELRVHQPRAGRRRGRAPPSQGKLHAVRLSEKEHHQDHCLRLLGISSFAVPAGPDNTKEESKGKTGRRYIADGPFSRSSE